MCMVGTQNQILQIVVLDYFLTSMFTNTFYIYIYISFQSNKAILKN